MTGWPSGVAKHLHDSIDSTNEEARRLLDRGQAGPLWVAAKQQTAGRGRQGRNWSSEPGNLAATYLAPVSGGPAEAALLSFAAALAVADTLEGLAPDQVISLKWPNDVLLNNKKTCGILLESFGSGNGSFQIAIGIGLNLIHAPPDEEANWPPTSIGRETGVAPDFELALTTLAAAIAARLAELEAKGFAATREAWLACASHLGQDIQVRLPRETLTGRFAGLDITGALVLEQPTGTRLIAAGDVFFPEAA